MRTAIFLLFFLLGYNTTFAQKPLANSRTSGYYTYFYRLTDADMASVYSNKKQAIAQLSLSTPINSVLTDRYKLPRLKAGNYLKVVAEYNKLNYALIENHTADLKILDNQQDLLPMHLP